MHTFCRASRILVMLLCAFFAVRTGAQMTINWQELGPNNVGGRTRSIAVSPDGNTIWAGTIGGGLFRSDDKGISWYRVSLPVITDAKNIASIAINGSNIYVGTGDLPFGPKSLESAIPTTWNSSTSLRTETSYYPDYFGTFGEGVYVSTDNGGTWSHNNATWTGSSSRFNDKFNAVTKIEVGGAKVFATSLQGLYYTTDNFATITQSNGNNYFKSNPILDVEVAGSVVLASTRDSVYRSTDGGVTFGNGLNASFPLGTSAPSNRLGGHRISIAVSDVDPNTFYVSGAFSLGAFDGRCTGVFKSTDAGATWTRVVPFETGTSSLFAPLGKNGPYALTLEVFPGDPDKILIAGSRFYIYSPDTGLVQAASTSYTPGFTTNYLPSAILDIAFDPTNPNVYYIGTDKEIMKTFDNGTTYVFRTKGLNASHLFNVDPMPDGSIYAGDMVYGALQTPFTNTASYLQSWADPYVTGIGKVLGNPVSIKEVIMQENDASSAGTLQTLIRSSDFGYTTETFYGGCISNVTSSVRSCLSSPEDSAVLNWADDLTPAVYRNLPNKPYTMDFVLASGAEMHDSLLEETPMYLYTASRKYLLVANNPFGSVDSAPKWNVISPKIVDGTASANRDWVTAIAVSGDNSHTVYVGTAKGNLYRVTNANDPVNLDLLTDFTVIQKLNSNAFSSSCGVSGALVDHPVLPNQGISDIEFDPSNPNNLVITYAGFNALTSYVYVTNNAMAASPTFYDVGSTMGSVVPAYCAAFYPNGTKRVLAIGTEDGVWISMDDYTTGSTLSWTEQNLNMGRIPVMDLNYREWMRADLGDGHYKWYRDHALFVATNGRGAFYTDALVGIDHDIDMEDDNFLVYPNPANQTTNLRFEMVAGGTVNVEIFTLDGRQVHQEVRTIQPGTNIIEWNAADMPSGIYLIKGYVETASGKHTYYRKLNVTH